MAAPSAPSKPVLRPGPEPQSLWVYGNDVATATYYNCYLDPATGVAATQYKMVQKCTTDRVPKWLIQNIPFWGKVFVTLTAFNVGDEESSEATENSIAGSLIGG